MATQIEPLNLRITGSADGLSAALASARDDTKRFGNDVGGISGALRGMAAGVAPVAGALTAGFAAIAAVAVPAGMAAGNVIEQFSRIDDIADSAERLGLSFTDLKAARIALGEATGMQGEQVDDLLAKTQRGLAEAVTEGSGKVYDRLKQLGLDAQELIAAGPTEAIARIADRVSELENPADRVRAAYDLFGKSAKDVVGALSDGGDKIREANKWAQEQLGLSDSQVDTVGRLNDAWGRIGALVEQFWQVLAAEAAPVVEELLVGILDIADQFGGVSNVAENVVDTMAYVVGLAADWLELLTANYEMLAKIGSGDFDLSSIGKTLEKAFTFDKADEYQKAVQDAREKAKATKGDGGKANVDSELAAIEKAEKAAEDAKKAAEQWEKKADDFRRSLETPIEAYNRTISDLQDAMDKGGLEWDVFARGVEKAAETLRKSDGGKMQPPDILKAETDRAGQLRAIALIQSQTQRQDFEKEGMEIAKQTLQVARNQLTALNAISRAKPPVEPPPINLS